MGKDKDRHFTLRNGGQSSAATGEFVLSILQELQAEQPRAFDALVTIATTRGPVPEEELSYLRENLFLKGPHDEISPFYKDVLLSALQQTAEGPVLVNPFRVPDPETAFAIGEERMKEWTKITKRARKLLRPDDPESGPDRGRE